MPHWTGLLTTAEVTQKTSAYTSAALAREITYWVTLIKEVQDFSITQREVTVNKVVDTNVERFFRLQLGYGTPNNTTGQPAGFTLLEKITW